MSSIFIKNKPEKTEFTKLYEDKSEELKVEVCDSYLIGNATQYDDEKLFRLNRENVEWLIGILQDSLKLTDTNE